jgi:hypothetical protein
MWMLFSRIDRWWRSMECVRLLAAVLRIIVDGMVLVIE